MNKGKLVGALGALGTGVYFVSFHWGRFLQDFWPPDNSRVAPNITAAAVQYAVIGIGLYLLYPPARRAVDKWVANHLRAGHAALHEKLDHIIKHHPSIPPLPASTPKSGSDATPPESPASTPPAQPSQ